MKKNDGKSKQVILIRKDLNMSPGKLGAQVAHASVAAILDKSYNTSYHSDITGTSKQIMIPIDDAAKDWFTNRFTKICLSVNSEEELIEFYNIAKKQGLRVSLIKDAGFTEFDEPTYTCVGIGPESNEEINAITGKLKLYK